MSHPYLSDKEEEEVLKFIRGRAGKRRMKKYPTDDKLKDARLFHDLHVYDDEEAFWFFEFLTDIVAIDPIALPAVDDRYYFPPSIYTLIPFVNSIRSWCDKEDNYYPLTVKQLLDACRPLGTPNTFPDKMDPSIAGKIMWRWGIQFGKW